MCITSSYPQPNSFFFTRLIALLDNLWTDLISIHDHSTYCNAISTFEQATHFGLQAAEATIYFTHFSPLFWVLELDPWQRDGKFRFCPKFSWAPRRETLLKVSSTWAETDEREQIRGTRREMHGLSNIANHRDSWTILKGWTLIQIGGRSVPFSFHSFNTLWT